MCGRAYETYTDEELYFRYLTNLRGVTIPRRQYHAEFFTQQELPEAIRRHGLPGDAWRTDPQRLFDVYVEAQLCGDGPVLDWSDRRLYSEIHAPDQF